jgi:hypothetical protein
MGSGMDFKRTWNVVRLQHIGKREGVVGNTTFDVG